MSESVSLHIFSLTMDKWDFSQSRCQKAACVQSLMQQVKNQIYTYDSLSKC